MFVASKCFAHIEEFLHGVEVEQSSSGLQGIDCIYVINLDERIQRWNKIAHTFERFGLKVNRVRAVNGWKLPSFDCLLLDPSKRPLTKGEMGCFLSHLSVYADALQRGFSCVWICEDDIEFNNEVAQLMSLLASLEEIDPQWDMLYTDYTILGQRGGARPLEGEVYSVIDKPVSDLLRRVHGRYGHHSVIFSRRGLEKIFSYFCSHLIWAPIDVEVHYIPGIREYSVTKSITRLAPFPSDTQVKSELNH